MKYHSIKKLIRLHAKIGKKRKGLPLLFSQINPAIVDVRHGVFNKYFTITTNQLNIARHAINEQINGIPFQ